jgi:hypothetical protein
MRFVRPIRTPEPPATPAGGDARVSGGESPGDSAERLNLLLSYAGWRDDSWADRLPRLLEPMGVRSLRAGSAREAQRVLQSTRVHIAVVDLGLPMDPARATPAAVSPVEEAGARLLQLLQRLEAPPPTVVVRQPRSVRDDRREIAAALRLGAFAVVDRPHGPGDLEAMLDVLSRALRRFYAGRWPGLPNQPPHPPLQ